MFWRRFWVIALIVVLVAGLLGAGGYLLYNGGWSQGYEEGQEAAGGEVSGAEPYVRPRFHFPRWGVGFAPFHFLGLFFKIVFVLLLVGLIAKLLGFWGHRRVLRWHRAGPEGTYWTGPWYHPHGPTPPWYRSGEQPAGEGTEPDEEGGTPDAKT
jgi:hypothetical protein